MTIIRQIVSRHIYWGAEEVEIDSWMRIDLFHYYDHQKPGLDDQVS